MNKLIWGRKKENRKKKNSSADIAGVAAVVCAVICAFCLCAFTVRGNAPQDIGRDSIAVFSTISDESNKITYTKPDKPDEWSFWGYLSDLFSGVFGVSR